MVNYLKQMWVWASQEPEKDKRVARLILLFTCSLSIVLSIFLIVRTIINGMLGA